MPRWRLFYHVVWATKNRAPLIDPSMESSVGRKLRDVANRHGIIVHALGGMEDHLHIAISIPPKMPVSEAIRRLKGGSSHSLKAEFGPSFAWQNEYSVDSFSQRHLKYVVAYIDNQREHHQAQTLLSDLEPIPDID